MKDYRDYDYDYYLKRFHILVSVLAALVVTAICIYNRESLYSMAIFVSVTIACFYVVGSFIRFYLVRRAFPPPHKVYFDDEFEDLEAVDDINGINENNNMTDEELLEMQKMQKLQELQEMYGIDSMDEMEEPNYDEAYINPEDE